MAFKEYYQQEVERLQANLSNQSSWNESIVYPLDPPGKLFRPLLLQSIGKDLQVKDQQALLDLGMAVECHHAYTLVHDDLPCMDDDDERRGRPSTHKKYSEWQAILIGDALLNLSYDYILKTNYGSDLRDLTSSCFGSRGVLLGQYLDLKLDHQKLDPSPSILGETHLQKTAKLIIWSVLAPYLITGNQVSSKSREKFIQLYRLGRNIGLCFQLKDDLDDFEAGERSAKNIFVHDRDHQIKVLEKMQNSLRNLGSEFKNVQDFLNNWL